MSLDWLADVKEFQQKFGFTVNDVPTVPPLPTQQFRANLITEEIKETLYGIADDNLVEIADGICDAIYVLLGTAVSYGIDLRPIWDEVHRSNMAKTEGPTRGDGTKPLKPDGWQGPAVNALLTMQSTGYNQVAAEYFDARHRTCRNFDVATKVALTTNTWAYRRAPILELGAGKGRCLEYLGISASVQVDSSIAMLNLQPREPGVRVVADARRLPFPDNSFASSVAFLCDPFMGPEFLRELARVTCTAVLMTVPHHEWAMALRGPGKDTTTFVLSDGSKATVPSPVYTHGELGAMLLAAGFTDIEITGHCLPITDDPSDAVIQAAENAGVVWTKLPIVSVLRARKKSD